LAVILPGLSKKKERGKEREKKERKMKANAWAQLVEV